MQRADRTLTRSALALAAAGILGAFPPSLASLELGGSTLFQRAPWRVELVSYTTDVGQLRPEYFFTVELPQDAGASLGELQIRQTRGVDRNFRFSPERTEAFLGRPRRRGPALPVEASFSQEERLITVRFPQPVAPGSTVTVRLKPWTNPMMADTYMFQVTAFPAGPNPTPARLGFGTLRIYRQDWR
ncbi:MAG: DUF2808 domain-containing protein [Cyanobium sp. M30B3]|jgi:hypothetical protein|nr:MAG: DUF2808 domain-containing protein [Cyanobium sp. M30B3]